MRLFGRRGHEGMGAKPRTEEKSGWESLGEVELYAENGEGRPAEKVEEKRDEAERFDAERQQRKIMAAMLRGVDEGLKYDDVIMGPQEEKEALGRLSSGEIDGKWERDFLSHIASPMELRGQETVFRNSVVGEKHMMRFLADATDVGFYRYQEVNVGTMGEFVKKYPLPMDYEPVMNALLENIRANNPPAKYEEYQAGAKDFMKAVYGKRYEYWEQMKALNEKAGRSELAEEARGARSAEMADRRVERGLETDEARAERQQDKIMMGMLHGIDRALASRNANISEQERAEAMEKMKDGEIDGKWEREFLSDIMSPIEFGGAKHVFESAVSKNMGASRALSSIMRSFGVGESGVTASTLERFVKEFPLPMDLEPMTEFAVERAKRNGAPEADCKAYLEDVEALKKMVYGKRYEYWEQMKALNEKAGRPELADEARAAAYGGDDEQPRYF